jgi:hypothetical protein
MTKYETFSMLREQVVSLMARGRRLHETAWIKGFFIDDGRTEACAVDVHFDAYDTGGFVVRINVLSTTGLSPQRAAAFTLAFADAAALAQQVSTLTEGFRVERHELRAFFVEEEQVVTAKLQSA